MCKSFPFLKANEQFAQYCYREAQTSEPSHHTPQKHAYRTIFSCDRDRVMYCSSFRTLSSKTQVFNSQTSDNLRTRLTHTLEVSQIARTISRQLGLDEDLTEAIALGHDVGHTPFGHIGERTLNKFSIGDDKRQKDDSVIIDPVSHGFKHNLQSVRVLVEYSERYKFSNYMLFGVREHSRLYWKHPDDVAFYKEYEQYCSYSYEKKLYPAWSFEAFIVMWADEVAQRHHDIEDAFFRQIMPPDDIVKKVEPLLELVAGDDLVSKFNRLADETERLNRKDFTTRDSSFARMLSSFLVDAYVTILINEISDVLNIFCEKNGIANESDFTNHYCNLDVSKIRSIMKLSNSDIAKFDKKLGNSLKYSILDSYEVQRMDGKGAYVMRKLVRAYTSNPQQLPNEYINRFVKVELPRHFDKENINLIIKEIRDKLPDMPRNISVWKDYECREALRAIVESEDLYKKTYQVLLRTIFDYISSMTDAQATIQRTELY